MFSRLKTVIALMRNPKVSNLPKVLVVGAIAYVLWPLDAVPDVAFIVGWLDDLVFLIGALSLLFSAAPRKESPGGQVIDVTPEDPGAKPPDSQRPES